MIKRFIKKTFPGVVVKLRRGRASFKRILRGSGEVGVFDQIMRENRWNDAESVSGEGSNMQQTELIRRELPLLLRRLGVKSMTDAPCGDFNWMRAVDLNGVQYTGVDVVSALTQRCQERYGGPDRHFVTCNIIEKPVPTSDLIFSRDCLVHLSYEHVFAALRNFKQSGATWLLTTTFPLHGNWDIVTGDWRPINLQEAPFLFPPPLEIINEGVDEYEGEYNDKSLGLWRIDSLPI
jgi:hypothetical protein